MNRIKISLDHVRHRSKPKFKMDVVDINNRIGKKVKAIPREFLKGYITSISKDGQSFCPATFTNGTRKTEYFEQKQMFVLDFDGKLTLQEVFDRAEEYDLPILFSYETFDSVNQDRFRIVFLNDVSIPDVRVAKLMLNILHEIFPEADKQCNEVARLYFGGKKLLYYDESIPEINIELLVKGLTICFYNRYGDTHYKKHLERFAKVNGVAITKKKMLDISMVEDYYDTSISMDESQSTLSDSIISQPTPSDSTTLQSSVLQSIVSDNITPQPINESNKT